jgi:hypothetical protein
MVEYTLNTASLGGEDLEYAWSINSDHTGEEDESAWVKLDLDGGEFVVGGADNVKLIANAGLQVDNAASTFNSPSTFNAQTNLNADVTASAVMLSTVAPSAGPGLWVSSSNPALGGGNESYAGIWLGSGSMGGGGFSGAAIGLSNFYDGGKTLLTVRSKAGNLMLQSDAGDTIVKATAGEVILSGSTRVISHTDHNFQALATFNAGASVNNTALTINSSLQNNGISTFNDTATFNNSASVHNQGITVNNAASTFNSAASFNAQVNFNAVVTASAALKLDANPGMTNPNLWISSSNPAFGPGKVYGNMWFGSGSVDGQGQFTGASMQLHNFGAGTELRLRSPSGSVTIRSDAGDTTVKASDGEVILSGSEGVLFHTEAVVNAGMNVNNSALQINSSLQNNGVSTFNDTATFNNSASVHNQGINVNNARGTFNSGLTVNNASAIFNDSVTLGDASGDGVTWNAGSWNMSANSVVTTLKDGVDGTGGPGGNGAWMIMTGSGGDFMRFHTSGSAKGIYFPQQTYLSKGGSLSGTLAGPGSFLAIDSDNKVILATPSGGGSSSPGGSDTQIQFNQNGSFAGSSGLAYDGSGSLSIDKDHADTTANANIVGVEIDFDKTGASTSNNTMYGLKLDMDNTTATDGANFMYGIHATPTLAHAAAAGTPIVYGAFIAASGSANGTSLAQAARFEAGGADINYGLVIDCEDGVDNVDLRIESSADNGDYFQIQTTTHGATTIKTYDDDATAAHLTCSIDGNILLDPAGGKVQVDGNLHINQYIYHRGDADTYINFTDDDINITVGGINMVDFSEGGTDEVTFNESAQQLDVRIEGESDPNLFFTDAVNNLVGIGTNAPQAKLHVSSSVDGGLLLLEKNPATAPVLVVSGSGKIGVNTASPKTSFDVHFTGSGNPINLSNDTGGGQVVFFGTGSADLAAGGVYYLNRDGGWAPVNSATTGSGHNQMLAISIGTKPLIHGMLLKGFFDVNTNFSGSFRKGGPVYVQSSSAGVRALGEGGYLSSSAPTAANSYVRAVGYGTDTANVIYFNPDSTYVEIG